MFTHCGWVRQCYWFLAGLCGRLQISAEAQLYVNSSSVLVATLWWPISSHTVSHSLADWLSCSPTSDRFPAKREKPSSFPRLWLHACSLLLWGNQGCGCIQAVSLLLGNKVPAWCRVCMGLSTKQQGECVWAIRECSDFLLWQVSRGFLEFYPDLFKIFPATGTPANITDDLKVADNSKGNSPA